LESEQIAKHVDGSNTIKLVLGLVMLIQAILQFMIYILVFQININWAGVVEPGQINNNILETRDLRSI
jgi:hypothetical protein